MLSRILIVFEFILLAMNSFTAINVKIEKHIGYVTLNDDIAQGCSVYHLKECINQPTPIINFPKNVKLSK